MKMRKDFLIALIILFVIPVTGYFVLQRAANDRMKVSATLQPKDSITKVVELNYLNDAGVAQTTTLKEMPYLLKVIATDENLLETDHLDHILYIINDRRDLAFLLYEPELKHSEQGRIIGYHQKEGPEILKTYGDILLVDVFNRILQVYDPNDPELYGKLLEDISYAFPMVDYRLEKLADNAKQSGK